jgi:two-component system, chemotaxis family, protein-glutamate methylesterase/glutaminase
MEKVGVLVVDSDVVMRQVLVRLIRQEPAMTVAGVASSAAEAVQLLRKTTPKVIFLELESEEGPVPENVSVIRSIWPDLPIVGLCRRSEGAGGIVLGALGLGIDDFLTKPETRNGVVFAADHFAKRLGPMVRALVPAGEVGDVDVVLPPVDPARGSSLRRATPRLVVVGAGTGGPKALFSFLAGLPASFPVPILVAQHMPRGMTSALARGFDGVCPLPVREAVNGWRIHPGTVWLAPGGRHLVVASEGRDLVLSVHRGPREHGSRPSINVLFRSAIDAVGGRLVGVMLSGYGSDGVEQAEAIRSAGGSLLVQDRASALVWELPERVARTTEAEAVPIERMADVLGSLMRPAAEKRGPKAGRVEGMGTRRTGGSRVRR